MDFEGEDLSSNILMPECLTLVHPQINLSTPLCYSVGLQCQQSVHLVFDTRGRTVVKCDDKVFVGGGATSNIV